MTEPVPIARSEVAMTTRGRRSLSVSAISAMGMLGGVAATFAAIVGVLFHPSLRAALAITAGPAALFVAVGLWRRREWARQSTIGVMALSIGYTMLLLAFPSILERQIGVPVRFRPLVVGQFIFYSAINGLIMAKLLTKRVRAEFEDTY